MSYQTLKDRALSAAQVAFGEDWHVDGWSIAPGRIEIIGNHIDYNGGPVLAGAIDRVVVIGSGNLGHPGHIAIVPSDVSRKQINFNGMTIGDWKAGRGDRGPIVYVKGIVASLLSRGIPFRTGVGLAIAGDIPRGFGVSSSAAFCLATILALTIDELEPREMVAIAREAEHRAGSPVGAMDQSASMAGNVILFDGRDNSFEQMTPDLGDNVFAIASSGVDRSLRTSSYAKRVKESDAALKTINEAYGFDLPNLAALTLHWDEITDTLPDHLSGTLLKRVRHVVTETGRVYEAVDALHEQNWGHFGALMNESGRSSASDYEISHRDVEQLVYLLRKQEGVLGARMMGGGEGGPALALLHQDAVEEIGAVLHREFYAQRTLKKGGAPFQICIFGPGAHRESV